MATRFASSLRLRSPASARHVANQNCMTLMRPRRFSVASRRFMLGGVTTSMSLTFGAFRVIPDKRVLVRANQPVYLPSRAYEILLALIERSGQLVTKNELIARVSAGVPIDERQLRVYISK